MELLGDSIPGLLFSTLRICVRTPYARWKGLTFRLLLSGILCSQLSSCSGYWINHDAESRLPSINISITPLSSQLMPGQSIQLAASVSGASNSQVSWSVNGIAGGSAAVGTVSSSGLYTAPAVCPNELALTVSAVIGTNSTERASASIAIQGKITIAPSLLSIDVGNSQQFTAMLNGEAGGSVTWTVDGVIGGNTTLGTISQSGLYTAPAAIPSSAVTVAALDEPENLVSADSNVTIIDPAVVAAHNDWLDGVAEAAGSYGCANISVQQQESETVPEAIDRFGQTASEGSCLVLWPISTNPAGFLYSLAWGGTIDGKNILYISDVSQMRIWNGIEVTGK